MKIHMLKILRHRRGCSREHDASIRIPAQRSGDCACELAFSSAIYKQSAIGAKVGYKTAARKFTHVGTHARTAFGYKHRPCRNVELAVISAIIVIRNILRKYHRTFFNDVIYVVIPAIVVIVVAVVGRGIELEATLALFQNVADVMGFPRIIVDGAVYDRCHSRRNIEHKFARIGFRAYALYVREHGKRFRIGHVNIYRGVRRYPNFVPGARQDSAGNPILVAERIIPSAVSPAIPCKFSAV